MFFAFLKVLLAGEFLSFDYKINPKKNQRPAVFLRILIARAGGGSAGRMTGLLFLSENIFPAR
ncbi:hypothetical protein TE10_17050 [Raoultella ornithinolytica]|uniref:hypothetical protein n=1 Tax=Raoultella TaxID=160674 RepID=UPI0005980FC5|nr:hypothetical protein [Raoultella terrigena]AJF73658.1 hypothetical protein TE10_17050 [Raoultella ornithinolytica]QIT28439.1 hypothetical protein HCK03_11055 [Raoultella terrigena]